MTQREFSESVKRNNQRLYAIALSFTKNSSDAEDILQNVFLKLWKYEKSFENETHIDKWLTSVCVNECKNYIKSPFKKRSVLLDEVKESYTFEEENDFDLFKAVMELPKKERIVIHLHYYEDMSVREIAKTLKITESAVKTRLHRARNRLKDFSGDELNE